MTALASGDAKLSVPEFPVFVPLGDDRLAAALTVPQGEPRGLILLMTGLGAHRSHRFGIWTRTARLLAERGIASIRFDYRGVGESTGELGTWRMSDVPTDQALAVLRFGMSATGADRVAAAGNCGGAWTALLVGARTPECVGVAFIRAPILAPAERGRLAHKASRSRLGTLVRSHKTLRKLARTALGRAPKRALDLGLAHARVLERGRILFLFGEGDYEASESVQSDLRALDERLSPAQRAGYELRVIPGRSLAGFDSIETQDLVVDAMVEWATALFARSGRNVDAHVPR
jgi:uncharacterized protein